MSDAELIAGVVERLPGEPVGLAEFARAYLRRLPPGTAADAEVLAPLVRSLFEFIAERPEPVAVRAFNPTEATHGYETGGTVIEVNLADGPFLLDSVSNEIVAHGLRVAAVAHPVVGVDRDAAGRLIAVLHPRQAVARESVQHYQLDRRLFEADLPALEQAIRRVLDDVRRAVEHFGAMRERVARMVDLVRAAASHVPPVEVEEAAAFLRWLTEDNFVFLGYREYRIAGPPGERTVQVVPRSGLGILADTAGSSVAEPIPLTGFRPDVAARYRGGDLLMITKTNRLSTVHRRVRMDYVGVRILGAEGETVGEARMLGLFTSKAYMEPAAQTPILRYKLAEIVAGEDLIEGSHDHKALVTLFEGFSKHDLFAAPTSELRETLVGMLAEQERERVRLFVRRDLLQRSVSILVTLPRDRFNTALRRHLQDLFLDRFNGDSIDYHLALGDTDPAQIHFTVWFESGTIPEVDFRELEREVHELTRSWPEQLVAELSAVVPSEDAARLVTDWAPRFPEYYATSVVANVAAGDILRLDALAAGDRDSAVGIQNEDPVAGQERLTRVALYRKHGKLPLSQLISALEDLGLTVVEEMPTRMERPDGYFIHDFGVLGPDGLPLDLEAVGDLVEEALEAVWVDGGESDDLARLIVVAGLRRRQVEVLRAYRTYWRRVAPVFTVGYVNDTLVHYPEIASALVGYFEQRFDPDGESPDAASAAAAITGSLDDVPSIEQDRILRTFLRLIEATLRTNWFVPGRACLALKMRSEAVPDVPRPHPMAEIFVLAPEVEGIHLRGGMVARGGIRWSTRREDYRTEVLGLMKAQVTKNAVIVPTGAKGGFVLRSQPADPAALRAEVERCYRIFIGGLLDVTDSLAGGSVVRPERVRAHDGDDPYLVVAADKGTAAFSDVANAIALDRGFWLGDAFASGGSSGYDHKALGITARGAWKSLERHFFELGLDPATDSFSAVGVGDMSGDVFGNGMLLSDRMRLVAAFDHRHVFLDPDPDPERSFAERRRLAGLAGSAWSDYDPDAISAGGGVFPRSRKWIDLSPEAAAALGGEPGRVTPTELIRLVLRAPVDVLWNGGIGTYVKASAETHDDAGDRTNDAVRVDGDELRARVAVEGGNLGLTQRGRIEYARAGGRVNTDFVDNSGGVDCSDREVNLKILLGMAVERGELDPAGRDALIAGVADDVVARILRSNALQAQLLSREAEASSSRVEAYEDLMVDLEAAGLLDRTIEALPGTDEMAERGRSGIGFTRPELAVLMAHTKRWVREIVAGSPLADDPHLLEDLREYFPGPVVERFGHLVAEHPLRRELAATIVANDVVDGQGIVFVSRLAARTGADPVDVVAAYLVAREVTGVRRRREELDGIARSVEPAVWSKMAAAVERMVSAVTRWYLAHPAERGLGERSGIGKAAFATLEEVALDCRAEAWRAAQRARFEELRAAGVPEHVACFQASLPVLASGPDLIEVADAFDRSPSEVLEVFIETGKAFGIDRVADLAADFPARTRWDRWAVWTIEEELQGLRRRAAERVLAAAPGELPAEAVARYLDGRPGAGPRLERFLQSLEGSEPDVGALTVATRQIRTSIG